MRNWWKRWPTVLSPATSPLLPEEIRRVADDLTAALTRAIGKPLADYMSEKVWQPAGMECDAFYTLESEGGQEIGGSRAGMVLRDFGRLGEYHPYFEKSYIEDGKPADQVGCVRHFTVRDGGGYLREQLLALSDDTHRCRYRILHIDADWTNYVAEMHLLPITEGNRCFGEWWAEWDVPADQEAEAVERVGHCTRCRDFSETETCAVCANGSRERQQLCAVESPADRLAIEHATGFRGVYFVLQGRLSPLDGIGPRELGLELLGQRLDAGEITEMIIATSATVEGEATAHYLAQLARARQVRPSRLAQGLPLGGELEFVDRGTLSHAFGTRSEVRE